jgi:hypothetical protein
MPSTRVETSAAAGVSTLKADDESEGSNERSCLSRSGVSRTRTRPPVATKARVGVRAPFRVEDGARDALPQGPAGCPATPSAGDGRAAPDRPQSLGRRRRADASAMCVPCAVLAHRVPNHVPNPADLTAPYPAEPGPVRFLQSPWLPHEPPERRSVDRLPREGRALAACGLTLGCGASQRPCSRRVRDASL